ncbi:MAG TPA: NADH-quinone oxidoreductase subunit J [Bacteroidota bacterium]|nr:NADH-quinone oxidoreductase subunit J [Bacteroidota bacterium]
MNAEAILFFPVAAIAVVSAVLMVTRRNPVMGVLFLIVNFFCLSVLYLTLHAQFIAVIQILVYAGAIMVLFLFVIMLLNLGEESRFAEKGRFRRIPAVALAATVLVEILLTVGVLGTPAGQSERSVEIGTVEFVGHALYTGYLLPFEITSLLLLAAMVGIIVLAKKKLGSS